MRKALFTIGIAVAIFLMGLGGGVALYHFYLHSVIIYTSIVRSYIHSLTAPTGTTTTELNPAYDSPGTAALTLVSAAPLAGAVAKDEWPSCNRTLTSEHTPLEEINRRPPAG